MIVQTITYTCDALGCPEQYTEESAIAVGNETYRPYTPPGWIALTGKEKASKLYCAKHVEKLLGALKP